MERQERRDQTRRRIDKMGYVSKKKSPRLFYFSVWVDFIVLIILYIGLIVYSVILLSSQS